MIMTKIRLNWAMQLAAVLAAGFALKFHYSTAGVNQLRWILAPTTWLVEVVTGDRFSFEAHAGYMSADHTFLIAASCAGVNFLLTAFLMMALGRLWRDRSSQIAWSFIPFKALLAFGATLVANTVRISTALRLHRLPAEINWLNPDQLHRFEGIFIYFGFLLLLYMLTERKQLVSETLWSWRWLFPLMIYYVTTLGVPLMNGAFRQGLEFWEHAAFVVATPLIFVMPLLAWRLLRQFSSRVSKSMPDCVNGSVLN